MDRRINNNSRKYVNDLQRNTSVQRSPKIMPNLENLEKFKTKLIQRISLISNNYAPNSTGVFQDEDLSFKSGLNRHLELSTLNTKDDTYMLTVDGKYLIFLTYEEIVKYNLAEMRVEQKKILTHDLFPFLKKMSVRRRDLVVDHTGNRILGIIEEKLIIKKILKKKIFLLVFDIEKGESKRYDITLGKGESVVEWIVTDGWKDEIFYKVEKIVEAPGSKEIPRGTRGTRGDRGLDGRDGKNGNFQNMRERGKGGRSKFQIVMKYSLRHRISQILYTVDSGGKEISLKREKNITTHVPFYQLGWMLVHEKVVSDPESLNLKIFDFHNKKFLAPLTNRLAALGDTNGRRGRQGFNGFLHFIGNIGTKKIFLRNDKLLMQIQPDLRILSGMTDNGENCDEKKFEFFFTKKSEIKKIRKLNLRVMNDYPGQMVTLEMLNFGENTGFVDIHKISERKKPVDSREDAEDSHSLGGPGKEAELTTPLDQKKRGDEKTNETNNNSPQYCSSFNHNHKRTRVLRICYNNNDRKNREIRKYFMTDNKILKIADTPKTDSGSFYTSMNIMNLENKIFSKFCAKIELTPAYKSIKSVALDWDNKYQVLVMTPKKGTKYKFCVIFYDLRKVQSFEIDFMGHRVGNNSKFLLKDRKYFFTWISNFGVFFYNLDSRKMVSYPVIIGRGTPRNMDKLPCFYKKGEILIFEEIRKMPKKVKNIKNSQKNNISENFQNVKFLNFWNFKHGLLTNVFANLAVRYYEWNSRDYIYYFLDENRLCLYDLDKKNSLKISLDCLSDNSKTILRVDRKSDQAGKNDQEYIISIFEKSEKVIKNFKIVKNRVNSTWVNKIWIPNIKRVKFMGDKAFVMLSTISAFALDGQEVVKGDKGRAFEAILTSDWAEKKCDISLVLDAYFSFFALTEPFGHIFEEYIRIRELFGEMASESDIGIDIDFFGLLQHT